MAKRPIDALKSWYVEGAYPTQEQFWDWLDSYIHKDDGVDMDAVNGLDEYLNANNQIIFANIVAEILKHDTSPTSHPAIREELEKRIEKQVIPVVVSDVVLDAAASYIRMIVTSQGTTDGEDITDIYPFPVASEIRHGIMPSESFKQISTNTADIELLKGVGRVSVHLGATPTQQQISDAWTAVKGSPIPEGATVVNLDQDSPRGHAWTYFEVSTGVFQWQDRGTDTVSQATNEVIGIVKGTATGDGKVFVENDGSMSVIGWDTVYTNKNANKSDVDWNARNFISKPTSVNTFGLKIDPDSYQWSYIRFSHANSTAWDVGSSNLVDGSVVAGSFQIRALGAATNRMWITPLGHLYATGIVVTYNYFHKESNFEYAFIYSRTGTGKEWGIGSDANGTYFVNRTDATCPLFMFNNGNVSIGATTNGGYKLGVYGTLYASGYGSFPSGAGNSKGAFITAADVTSNEPYWCGLIANSGGDPIATKYKGTGTITVHGAGAYEVAIRSLPEGLYSATANLATDGGPTDTGIRVQINTTNGSSTTGLQLIFSHNFGVATALVVINKI